MAISIWAVFEDGREALLHDDDDNFADAVEHAIDLADKYGSEAGGSRGSPKLVHVRRNGAVTLSLTVLRGGLIRAKDAGR